MSTEQLSTEEQKLQEKAVNFARANKKKVAKQLTNLSQHPKETDPVSVFMAGSPGAGKTEASKSLLQSLAVENEVIRIDPDELRAQLPGYNGDNAWLLQHATSIMVGCCIDYALKQKQSFLLDGICAIYDRAKENIERSLNKNRQVFILYVYQEPHMAWHFAKARETVEGRAILPETFVEQYFGAREVVNRLKREFGRKIVVDLLRKNIDGSDRVYKANIDQIDNHVPEKYSRQNIEAIVGL